MPRISREASEARLPSDRQAVEPSGFPSGVASFPVVGIGASAGGLGACRRLLEALPPDNGMAFILVQHLDPTHESMMVDLLTGHTSMVVRQAADGMLIEPGHLYVIPPGAYLSVGDGALRLSEPSAPHGARLPFDFLLHSLGATYAARAICIVLSGTGADGSLGLETVRKLGGLVIAQDPDGADYDGMPRSAISTGSVDLILPLAKIPDALLQYCSGTPLLLVRAELHPESLVQKWLPEIVDLLRTKTPHDFRHYKEGTLQRRIERRMGMAAIAADDMSRYIEHLRRDTSELETLAKDLLINVTGFFRDPKAFEFLAAKIIPELVRNHSSAQALRIWIAGCSTGEEAYSIAILFIEEIALARRDIKLQIFASDVDSDAVASAREGVYPEEIEADVGSERLARFFSKEGSSYRVLPEVRTCVVFTVHDVLADPPFSRVDLVSCRNLLIYLRPEAQAKAVSLFHFALRDGGILLLGSAETLGNVDGRFEVVSKPERVYRHLGRAGHREIGLPIGDGEASRAPAHPWQGQTLSRDAAFAELCRGLVLDAYAPATVLVNSKLECLYSLGPTEHYFRMAPGPASLDVLVMVRDGLAIKLRAAIQQAAQDNSRVVVAAGRMDSTGAMIPLKIEVRPIPNGGEKLLLICFSDEPVPERKRGRSGKQVTSPRVAELEKEWETTRKELHGAIRGLELSNKEQRAISQEVLSVNEEYQSTNEELLTSKEELQSLNEELAALNTQLQETLERQRTTANDLKNVLYSTNVATLFLDEVLDIRFFTPATKALFNLIPGDIGRPLADLNPVAGGASLLADARAVLESLTPIEREIEAPNATWYARRILPYRTQENAVEGVVVTFVDITERRQAQELLEAAKQKAEIATAAKSRFLAAASHDLRQPLQTLALIQGLLAINTEEEKQRTLLTRLDETLGAMSSMLNALLTIDQIEIGANRPEVSRFSVNELFGRLRDEFSYLAQAKKLVLRVVPCSLSISSDPSMLERMIRNLPSNALKYTKTGKVLLGCRRRKGKLSIEIWDTGIGIPEADSQAIFDEYHQIDNPSHEASLGFGLGLSIVRRLATALGHRVSVHSQLGKGTGFAVEILLPTGGMELAIDHPPVDAADRQEGEPRRTGSILVVEDDPEVSDLLAQALEADGHRVAIASSGAEVLDFIARRIPRPDVILTDYNLPRGMDGLQVIARLRQGLHRQIPAIILTGDMGIETALKEAPWDCVWLKKPVKLMELRPIIQRFLQNSSPVAALGASAPEG